MAKDNTIKEWNMKELAAYQQELFVKPKLTFLFFELTDKCNLTSQITFIGQFKEQEG